MNLSQELISERSFKGKQKSPERKDSALDQPCPSPAPQVPEQTGTRTEESGQRPARGTGGLSHPWGRRGLFEMTRGQGAFGRGLQQMPPAGGEKQGKEVKKEEKK